LLKHLKTLVFNLYDTSVALEQKKHGWFFSSNSKLYTITIYKRNFFPSNRSISSTMNASIFIFFIMSSFNNWCGWLKLTEQKRTNEDEYHLPHLFPFYILFFFFTFFISNAQYTNNYVIKNHSVHVRHIFSAIIIKQNKKRLSDFIKKLLLTDQMDMIGLVIL
jgi:hypothetical protein